MARKVREAALRGQQEPRVPKAHRGLTDLLVISDRKVCLVRKACLVRRELTDHKDIPGHKEPQVLLVR